MRAELGQGLEMKIKTAISEYHHPSYGFNGFLAINGNPPWGNFEDGV